MSEKRRQDLVYPPGPETQRERDRKSHRPTSEISTTTGRLFARFSLIRHDEEAILQVLRQVPHIDRLHARIALFQALGAQYTHAGPRALALCERVFGSGTVYFPSERESGEQTAQPSPETPAPLPAAEPELALEPEAAFHQGRIQTLCELLKRLVSQQPFQPASELLALLDAVEGHVAKAAISGLSRALLPGESYYGRTYLQALQQAAGEKEVSRHLSRQREVIERMLPGRHEARQFPNPSPPPPYRRNARGERRPQGLSESIRVSGALETRLLRHGGQLGMGQLLGSWDKSPTPEAKAQRHAQAEKRLAEDHPTLAVLGQGGGEPLPEAVLARMNRLLGHDFSHVRIHTDGGAAQAAALLGARALTLGVHVYFGAGQYSPGTTLGERLLIHELIHVVQHDQGRLPASTSFRISHPEDAAEQEARAAEESAGAPKIRVSEDGARTVTPPQQGKNAGAAGGGQLIYLSPAPQPQATHDEEAEEENVGAAAEVSAVDGPVDEGAAEDTGDPAGRTENVEEAAKEIFAEEAAGATAEMGFGSDEVTPNASSQDEGETEATEAVASSEAGTDRERKNHASDGGAVDWKEVGLGAADFATDFLPGVSNVKDAWKAVAGVNPVTGEKLDLGERIMAGIFAVPGVGNAAKVLGKARKLLSYSPMTDRPGVQPATTASTRSTAEQHDEQDSIVQQHDEQDSATDTTSDTPDVNEAQQQVPNAGGIDWKAIGIGAADLTTDFIPIVSNVKDAWSAITGVNPVTGEKLSVGERVLSGIFAIPGVGNVAKYIGKGGKLLFKAGSKLLKKVGGKLLVKLSGKLIPWLGKGKKLLSKALSKGRELLGKSKEQLGRGWGKLKKLPGWIKGKWQGLKDSVGQGAKWAKGKVQDLKQAVRQAPGWFRNKWDGLKRKVGSVLKSTSHRASDWLKKTAGSKLDGLKKRAGTSLKNLGDKLKQCTQWLGGKWEGLKQKVSGWATQLKRTYYKLRRTKPSLKPDPNAKPRGRRTQIHPNEKDPENIRALNRENDSADSLRRAGYDVEQNPPKRPNRTKKPDYRIENRIFDNYAPSSKSPRHIWNEVSKKVSTDQADRIVLNLNDSKVDMSKLAKQFSEWSIKGLKEIVVLKDGSVIPFWP